MIPLISSLAYGPLGACQLPRTWWKVLTRNAGILDAEYPDFSDGLDRRVLEVLALDRETTLAYLRENMPSYLDFEAWVLEQKGDAFWGFEQQDAIVRWNAFIHARRHRSPAKLEETYTDTGLPRDAGIDSATVLNSLQDWQLFYKRDLSSTAAEASFHSSPQLISVPSACASCPAPGIKSSSKQKDYYTPTIPT